MAQLTAHEQYMLELVNRARLDPSAEAARYGIGLNDGLSAGQISTASKQPLAANQFLNDAADNHSLWMLNTDTFSHTGANGSSPDTRMKNAGYVFSGNWSWGENISWRGTTGTLNLKTAIESEHEGLFKSSGHRVNMLNDKFQEVGIGVQTGVFQGYNTAMATQDFARSGTGQFLTGVAFKDSNGDKFYTPGEGLSGVSIAARLVGATTSTTTSTATAGGYQTKLAAGTYDVTLSGGGIASPLGLRLAVGAINVKLDLVTLDTVACSASVVMGSSLRGLMLLGTENLYGTGNTLANTIVGNAGANTLDGAAGADTLTGGKGNDVFVCKYGQLNGDVITDFTGNGSQAGDSIRFDGFSTSAVLQHVSGDTWRIVDGSHVETFRVTGTIAASDYSFVNSTTAPPPSTSTGTVMGSNGADAMNGTSAADTIAGNGGNDTISGNDGNDKLYGGSGVDRINGGNGNDTLVGGTSGDILTGGAGADSFVLRSVGERADTIKDFSKSAGNKLVLTDLFNDIGYHGTNPIADGYLRTVQSGSSVLVQIDSNGHSGGVSFTTVAALSNNTVAGLGDDFFVAAQAQA
jgi:Ca2+-binding RTX toxin-like protein